MCGICGYGILPDGERPPLKQMTQSLFHRGPDDCGSLETETIGTAMRRLAIIDVAGGSQPISNEDGQISIVFNGEIYNFQELTDSLGQRGHNFRTHSDTETIIHLYEDEDEETPKYLKGMFAFCIYDRRDNSLFLARDRFGEKPLYYYNHPNQGLVFSSEIRSLLECPWVPRRLNYEALGYYLRVGLVPTPLTMFQDIKILQPGYWLKWCDGHLTIRPYYAINYCPDDRLEREADAIEVIRETFKNGVRRQFVSEVPIGALLSGGIDSSSVVAMLQSISTNPVKTFTIRFEEATYDESAIARKAATHLNTEHYEFVVPNVAFHPDDLWRIVDHVGLPFSDSSAIPTYILSKHVRQEVTVALSGDGGDEMFAGYPFFQWGLSIGKLSKLPHPLRRSGALLANWFSKQPLGSKMAGLRRVRRALDASTVPDYLLPVAIGSLFEPKELHNLVRDKVALEIATGDLPLLTTLPLEAENWSPLRRLMYYRLKHNLPDDMLTKVDRMSMACSLEVRAPMLDVDLAELSMRLSDKHLIRNGTGKSILRKAMRSMLPDIVFNHPKSGFSIPLHQFQNAEYIEMARTLLSNQTNIIELFSSKTIKSTIESGLSRQSDRADLSVYRASHQLWSLMQLAAWAQRFKVSI